MKESQDRFVARRQKDWNELTALLPSGLPMRALPPVAISRAAGLYRAVAADLALARAEGFSLDLVGLLDGLAGRAHSALYVAPPRRAGAIWALLARDFPRALRRHVGFFAVAATLFVVPGLVGFTGALKSRAFAFSVLSEEQAEGAAKMYAEDTSAGRDESADVMMTGFYVWNNVGIAFRCFATGILFGLGSLFFIIYNGLAIGAAFGHVTAVGHGMNILTFGSGHGAFELTAIVISGQAGLLMGYALVATGGMTRMASLRSRAKDIAALILGAAVMLLIAAGIEGFWSPSGVPRAVKLTVAVGLWMMVAAYLTLAGRAPRGAGSP